MVHKIKKVKPMTCHKCGNPIPKSEGKYECPFPCNTEHIISFHNKNGKNVSEHLRKQQTRINKSTKKKR